MSIGDHSSYLCRCGEVLSVPMVYIALSPSVRAIDVFESKRDTEVGVSQGPGPEPLAVGRPPRPGTAAVGSGVCTSILLVM